MCELPVTMVDLFALVQLVSYEHWSMSPVRLINALRANIEYQ